MKFEIVYPEDQAIKDVDALLDNIPVLPKRRQNIQMAIDSVVEMITYGLVSINDSGEITQKLIKPVDGVEELKYKAHVDAATIQKSLKEIRVYTQPNVNTCYLKAYTGKLEATINKLEPADKNTAESISFFFQ